MNNIFRKVATPIAIVFLLSSYSLVLSPNCKAEDTEPKEELFYYLHDHLGGIDVVTDEDGNVVERKDYLPFGSERPKSEPSATGGEPPSENYGYTGKEQDNETGLYYYGARYYDPKIGRFTQIDPLVLGESEKPLSDALSNPQALNGYSYALNNPMRYVDEEGQYQKDVHYDLTLFINNQAGLNEKDAQGIAAADQYTDDSPVTGPWVSYEARVQFHFADQNQLDFLYSKATETLNYTDIGQYLHAMQDSKYSHAGFGALIGHVLWGHWPDITSNDVKRADTMAKETFYTARIFKSLIDGTGDMTIEMFNRQTEGLWDTIKDKIHNFNMATTTEDKNKALHPELYDKKNEKKDNK